MNSPRQMIHQAVAAWCDQNAQTEIAQHWFAAPQDRKDPLTDALAWKLWNIGGPHVQEGPTPEISASVILGVSPKKLAKGALTKKEAHLWVHQSEYRTPKEWLWAQVKEEFPELQEITRVPNTINIVRWVHSMMSDPSRKQAMLRRREGVFGEHMVGGRPVDRLDELQDEDLCGSPWRTIENAAQRILDTEWEGQNELIPSQKWHRELPKGVRVLCTYTDLRREGVEMEHCVVSYALRVQERKCLILSVMTKEGRTTAEIVDGKVVQHLGPKNTTPHASCIALLEEAVRRIPSNPYKTAF